MRVKYKILIFVAVVLGLIAVISIAIFNEVKYKNKVSQRILTLDSLQYVALDSTLHGISSGNNFKIIFFFNSECDHCQEEARLVSANASTFKTADVYFFSTEPLPAINTFAHSYGLNRNPFDVGRVDHNVIYRMGINTNPMCFIYAPDGKLLRKYAGQVKIEAIAHYLQ